MDGNRDSDRNEKIGNIKDDKMVGNRDENRGGHRDEINGALQMNKI